MTTTLLKRLRAMDGAELRFRAATALRTRVDRARAAWAPERWRREALQLAHLPELAAARHALERRDWMAAHHELARHFATRPPRFPLDPQRLARIGDEIARRFPEHDAGGRAARILAGRLDILGYRDVPAGVVPDWHRDPVHDRYAPRLFWDAVPYLDPACGDHKVTWEINRHQHFLALGRAFVLTGDARCYRTFITHLSDWMRENPPLTGMNWASMLELGFRSLSWLWALHFFAGAASAQDEAPWTVDLLLGVDRQLTHVEQNLSRYFSPNTHLTGEALALYVAGRALPELTRSEQRAGVGRDVLLAEAHRQVHADGGHAERSAHYHRYSTDFYLLALAAARITGDPAGERFREAAHRQARFLRALADDAGRLPLIGDDDGGQLFPIRGPRVVEAADSLGVAAVLLDDPALAVGPLPEEAFWICGSIAEPGATTAEPAIVPSACFSHTGYCISRDRGGNHLVFDCGPHGYLNGGHAHADALAIVATVAGRPLLVDSGTGTYTMDPDVRDRFRSTAMHNTVVVNGRMQSEPRGPFHWRSRADGRCTNWQPGAYGDYMEGRHDAYAPLRHTRAVMALHGIGWIVIDHLTGPSDTVEADAMWHVHPDWQVTAHDGRRIELVQKDRQASLVMSVPVRPVRGNGLDEYAPEYGRIERGSCFAGRTAGAAPLSMATFVSAHRDWIAHGIVELAVTHGPGEGWHAAAFTIQAAPATLLVLSAVERTTHEGGAPEVPWGTESFTTAARAAVVLVTPAGAQELCHVPPAVVASSMH